MQYTINKVYYGRCANGKLQAGIKKKLTLSLKTCNRLQS